VNVLNPRQVSGLVSFQPASRRPDDGKRAVGRSSGDWPRPRRPSPSIRARRSRVPFPRLRAAAAELVDWAPVIGTNIVSWASASAADPRGGLYAVSIATRRRRSRSVPQFLAALALRDRASTPAVLGHLRYSSRRRKRLAGELSGCCGRRACYSVLRRPCVGRHAYTKVLHRDETHLRHRFLPLGAPRWVLQNGHQPPLAASSSSIPPAESGVTEILFRSNPGLIGTASAPAGELAPAEHAERPGVLAENRSARDSALCSSRRCGGARTFWSLQI